MKFIIRVKFFIAAFILLLVITWMIAPRVLKTYIEKNSAKLTGRKIAIESIDVNYFTAAITLHDVSVFEKDQPSIFFGSKEIFLNVEFWKWVSGQFGVSEIKVESPTLVIIQERDRFNFDDLLNRFFPSDAVDTSETSRPVEYKIVNLAIENGIFSYRNKDLQNEIKLVSIQASCPNISWDDPKEIFDFNFLIEKGGKVNGNLVLDISSLDYILDYDLDSLNLSLFYPYVKDYMKAGSFSGLFSTQQRLYGNFNRPEAVNASGKLVLNDLLLTNADHADLLRVKEVKAVIDTLNVARELYHLRYISFLGPALNFDLFEEGNNFSRLLNEVVPDSSGVSSDSISRAVAYGNIFGLMATYIRQLSENYSISNYKADSVVLREGTLVLNDYTLHSRFNYALENLMVKAERVNSADKNITFIASSILNTSGHMEGSISVNPNGFRDMDIEYSITGLNITDFNPYSDFWVAHPFTTGTCNYRSKTSIQNRMLKSIHNLEMLNIAVGKKQKNSTAINLPVRFAVALLRDVNGNINLELPIEGNLDDPKYKLRKVIWQVLKNLINKAVAAPGKLLAKKSGVDENDIQGIVWKPLQVEIETEQQKPLDAILKLLSTTPEVVLEVVNIYNKPKEEDELALLESKKLYLLEQKKISALNLMTKEDQMLVQQVTPKDSTFNQFLDKTLNLNDPLISVYDKAKKIIGHEQLNLRTQEILTLRNQKIVNYLIEKGIDSTRIKVSENKTSVTIPYGELSKNNLEFKLPENL